LDVDLWAADGASLENITWRLSDSAATVSVVSQNHGRFGLQLANLREAAAELTAYRGDVALGTSRLGVMDN
jgi:hypothetical protein